MAVLPLLVVVGLVVLAGLVSMAMMLAHPKTRAVGIVLSLIGLMVLLVGGVLVLSYRGMHESHAQMRKRAMLPSSL